MTHEEYRTFRVQEQECQKEIEEILSGYSFWIAKSVIADLRKYVNSVIEIRGFNRIEEMAFVPKGKLGTVMDSSTSFEPLMPPPKKKGTKEKTQ